MWPSGRFVLVGHSLCGLGGHEFEYAVSILRSAESAGHSIVLATNRKFQRDDRLFRFLRYRGNGVFNPDGAQAVEIAFEVRGGLAVALAITDGDLRVTATRTGDR